MNKQKWEPLLEGNQKQLDTIIGTLEKEKLHKNHSLLGEGNTGAALLFYHYGRYIGKEKYIEKASSIILDNFDMYHSNDPSTYSLCNGMAGFRWAVNHLIDAGFIDGDADELFSDDDALLYAVMEKDIGESRYDYLHNAIGIGLYFMKRRTARSAGYIAALVEGLAKAAIADQDGLKWLSMFNLQEGEGKKAVYNLSLSHGMTSIISFLGKVYQMGIAQENVNDLLSRTVSYMLSHKLSVPDETGSFFPSMISAEDDHPVYGGRLAWCYGDLGLAYILLQVSGIVGNQEWEEIAMSVLLQSTTRKNALKERVVDAGFCHGSAGIAHIYNRLYQYTGNPVFKESALHWLDDMLRKAVFPDGPAGYKAWYPQSYGGWKSEFGLLQGISGIGLVLLAAISDVEPVWDECFLLS
ncbi:lanthionine synthetase C family protein [Sphingobacterium corticibacterium]|uniref:Lanthionine synthetase n=1 Tax=Sphingobacterium corticibacterium TaxID=2484746 RepID=A0A4Q6XS01_9SPHI|nr:lanthionine synthetase C family protein [Sphingobacterium corticibacterium]RZF60234.1 hypothetical protein EWE74_14095 [Sphingobacterium corticibacterium]